MTDDRAEMKVARDAGLVKRHEQRLARAQQQADRETVDRFLEDVQRAARKHPDLTVMTGAGGHRSLFPAEVERVSRILLRIIGSSLADLVDPPSDDALATDNDLARYDGRAEAAAEIRALALGAWDR